MLKKVLNRLHSLLQTPKQILFTHNHNTSEETLPGYHAPVQWQKVKVAWTEIDIVSLLKRQLLIFYVAFETVAKAIR